MKNKSLVIALILVSNVASASTYSVTPVEYYAVGGTDLEGDINGCVGSYEFERVDTITILPGTLEDGSIVGLDASHCGICPVGTVTKSVSASNSYTNTATKTVSPSISAGIGAVHASLDVGMSWADGSSTTITGSGTVNNLAPCQFQEGQLVFQYLGEKGKRINHDYTAYWVTSGGSYSGATTTCPHSAGTRISDGSASDSSDNVGSHYHQATSTYESTVGGTCSDCTPG